MKFVYVSVEDCYFDFQEDEGENEAEGRNAWDPKSTLSVNAADKFV